MRGGPDPADAPARIGGVGCAVATPFDADLGVDLPVMVEHCHALLEEGCAMLAVLGTTGEANSLGLRERMALLEGLVRAGIPARRLLPGTGCCAAADTVEMTRHAAGLGVMGVVMLPPFYYPAPTEAGLIAAYARVVDGLGHAPPPIVFYHIPQVSGVPIPSAVIAALRSRYPGVFAGIKDSAGDLDRMLALVKAHPGLAVLAGADPLLLPLLRGGGAGCITAAANLGAADLAAIAADPDDARGGVEAAQARIVELRRHTNEGPQIATVKAMLAVRRGHAGWRRMRPPNEAIA